MSFSASQFKVLSNFFLDSAKGLALAAVVGQGFVGEISGLLRISFSTIWLGLALFSLYIALYCTKEEGS